MTPYNDRPACVLAGDIGGTNTRLAGIQVTNKKLIDSKI